MQDKGTDVYSTCNEGKSVVAEKLIRNLKNKSYKHMIAVSKNVNINKPDEIADKNINTCHRTFKMKTADVNSRTYINLTLRMMM